MARFGSLGTQYFDNAGNPLIDGKIYFFESGSTTPKNTFADVNETIPNPNPVLLTAAGRQPNIFFSGTARAVLTESDDTQVEVRDPVGSTDTFGQFSNWAAAVVYAINDIVLYNDRFWISLANNNVGNEPSQGAFWIEVFLVTQWGSGYNYQSGMLVIGSDGGFYRSLIDDNLNNDPVISPAEWAVVGSSTLDGVDLLNYGEITNEIGAIGGGTQDIDLELGNSVSATVDTAATTFTFSNPKTAPTLSGFTLTLTDGGSQTITWPASVDWPNATAPTLSVAGVDILVFYTIDGGITWHGMVASLLSS